MPYRVDIQDLETGKPIAGTLTVTLADGRQVYTTHVPVTGIDIPTQFDDSTITITASGYHDYSVLVRDIYSVSHFRLRSKPSIILPFLVGAAAAIAARYYKIF